MNGMWGPHDTMAEKKQPHVFKYGSSLFFLCVFVCILENMVLVPHLSGEGC